MTGILALAACTTSTPGPPPTASGDTGEPAAAIAETVGTFAFTSSFADLGLPDGGARRFHLHDALPAFGLHLPFAADFDGDGRDAVGILDDRGGLRFGSDNASGVLAERREVAAGRWPLAGDFDGDGADDFGTVDPETGDVEIWSGLPAGAPAFTLSIPAGWTAVGGDFDGDGVEGLAAYDGYAGDVEIHEPLGSSPRRFLAGTGGYPVAGDLDGDGTDAFGVYGFDRTLTWFDDTGASTDRRVVGSQIFFQWPLVGAWSTSGALNEAAFDFPTAPPEDRGFDAPRLAKGADDVGALGLTNSLVVLHRGAIVEERYWRGFDASMANNVKSVAKSLLSALVGIAADEGLVRPDASLAEYLPAYFGNDDRAEITLRQLMTMSAGLAWTEATSLPAMIRASDWVGYVLGQTLAERPGVGFRYSTGNTHVGAALLEAVIGEGLPGWADRKLFAPLGITFTRWDVDPDGRAMGGAEVWMRPRDLARFGQLYLAGGELDGRRVLSEAWIEQTLTVDTAGFFGAGYGWWWRRWVLDGAEAWAAVGYGGQLVVIVPSRELVVVTTSEWSVDASTGDAQIGDLFTLLDTAIVAAAPSQT